MDNLEFEDLEISLEILEDLRHNGFTKTMPIQALAIPHLMKGADLIAQAKTGTGKTLAFAIPLIQALDPQKRRVQALVVTPTRELALQVAQEIQKVGYRKKIKTACVYGGKSINEQAKKIKSGASVIVGTPGRILDLIGRGILRLDEVKVLVLDEADRMLDMGFIRDIQKIISYTPNTRQTMLFSATIGDEVRALAQDITRDPHHITTGEDELVVEDIHQTYYETSDKEKLDVFEKVVKEEMPDKAIIFCNTKRWSETLIKLLRHRGINAQAIHGDMSQNQRENVIAGFKSRKFKYLVATDVASRGLDIDDVTHVFNYDIPNEPMSYVHRIGRTARAGKNGKAISFITSREIRSLWDIENRCRTKINEVKLNPLRGTYHG
ncbi:MAG: DEAD/DEAH box helicase [Candidatus Altiarchaeota archaeon]|nr:DEAD/DEAH box helicase [Candidatus Altiarchaeota archaeon]